VAAVRGPARKQGTLSDETNFFKKYQQSDYKKSNGRIFGAATTPGR
jgi:hypothetical protein